MAKRSPSQSRRSAAAAAAAEEEGAGEASRRWCLSPPLGLCFFLREGGREVEVEVEVEFYFSSASSLPAIGLSFFLSPFQLSSLPTLRRSCSSRSSGRPVRRVQALDERAGRGRGAEGVGVGRRESRGMGRHVLFLLDWQQFRFLGPPVSCPSSASLARTRAESDGSWSPLRSLAEKKSRREEDEEGKGERKRKTKAFEKKRKK